MLFQERLLKIMALIEKRGMLRNSDLVKLLNISESTIRRDLDYLEKENKILRVRGGAVLNRIEKEEVPIDMKEDVELEAKRKIAKIASKYIKDGDYIYLDAGTTTHQLIEHLKEKNIKVVTNGIMHLEKLMKFNIETYLVGGKLKRKTKAIVGARAIEDLADFTFDKAFIGTNGISELNGYTTADIEEALLKRKAIRQSNKVYILADSTKFDISYFANIAKLEEAIIITNKKDINEKFTKITKIINEQEELH